MKIMNFNKKNELFLLNSDNEIYVIVLLMSKVSKIPSLLKTKKIPSLLLDIINFKMCLIYVKTNLRIYNLSKLI